MPSATLTLSLRRKAWRRLWAVILQHSALARSRRALARLDDHLLRDIGLSRHEAETEAERPLWTAPPHWRQRES